MGMEDIGLDTKKHVTTPGEPGYKGAWDKNNERASTPAAHPDTIRDAAIEGADVTELEDAVSRMEKKENPDAETLAALARVRSRLDELIQKNQH